MEKKGTIVSIINDRWKLKSEESITVAEISAQSVETSPVFNENGMIVASSVMRQIIEEAKTIAPLDVAVLITGDTGVGKEELARFIHQASGRSRDFVALNSSGLAPTLAESELFGHSKGAFTGASENKIGYFQQAYGGTLFLDEIGDMSLETQAKILRAVDNGRGEFCPVGSTKKISADFRLISASNRNLKNLIEEKKFRLDLFYRLNGINLRVPSLRERPDDIIILAQYFLRESCQKFNKKVFFSKRALMFFLDYDWPGNVRELKTVIERGVALVKTEVLEIEDCRLGDESPKTSANPFSLQEKSNELERELIIKALNQTRWVQTNAIKLLGCSRRILKYKMDKFGIKDPDTANAKPEEQVAKSMVVVKEGKFTSDQDRSEAEKSQAIVVNPKNCRIEYKKESLIKSLEENGWNQTLTAQASGICRTYLNRLLKKFDIIPPTGRWKRSQSPNFLNKSEERTTSSVKQKVHGMKPAKYGKEALIQVFKENDWDQTKTSKAIKTSQPYLSTLAKKYGIVPPQGSWRKVGGKKSNKIVDIIMAP